MFNHGLDRRAASYTWTVLFILLLLAVVYLIRETLFVFALALLFSYLLWPLVGCLRSSLPLNGIIRYPISSDISLI